MDSIVNEIMKLRKKPSSVIEEMKDTYKVAKDKLKVNDGLTRLAEIYAQELMDSPEEPGHENPTPTYADLVGAYCKESEVPFKNYIFYGDYEDAKELLNKITKKQDEFNEESAALLCSPDLGAIGCAVVEPANENKKKITMITVAKSYTEKEDIEAAEEKHKKGSKKVEKKKK